MKKGDLREFRFYPHGEHHIHVYAEVVLSRGILPVSYQVAKNQEFDHEAAIEKHKDVGEHWLNRLDKLHATKAKSPLTRTVNETDHTVEIVDCTLAYGCLNDWELIVQFFHNGILHSIRKRYEHPNIVPDEKEILAMVDALLTEKVEKQKKADAHTEKLEKLRGFLG